MYVTQFDELIDNVLNKFNDFLIKNKLFDKIIEDINFVKYQKDIFECIKKFIENTSETVIPQKKRNYRYYKK